MELTTTDRRSLNRRYPDIALRLMLFTERRPDVEVRDSDCEPL